MDLRVDHVYLPYKTNDEVSVVYFGNGGRNVRGRTTSTDFRHSRRRV